MFVTKIGGILSSEVRLGATSAEALNAAESVAELKEVREGDFLGLPPCPTTTQSVEAEVSMAGESDSGRGCGLLGRLAAVQPEGPALSLIHI